MATRREGEARFDHGAQYFTARDPGFIALCERGRQEGWIAPWRPRVIGDVTGDMDWLVPVPDMSTLPKRLLSNIEVRAGAPVTGVRRDGDRYHLRVGDALSSESFDGLILTAPPLQSAELLLTLDLPSAEALRADLATVAMLPCWALMATTPDSETSFDVARSSHGTLAWVARNDSKPGRAKVAGLTTWVAHASVPWSVAHLESTKEVSAALQSALLEVIGNSSLEVVAASAHRWRYARPDGVRAQGPLFDAGSRLGVCGDFLASGRVESAYLSGRELAGKILNQHR